VDDVFFFIVKFMVLFVGTRCELNGDLQISRSLLFLFVYLAPIFTCAGYVAANGTHEYSESCVRPSVDGTVKTVLKHMIGRLSLVHVSALSTFLHFVL